MPNDLTLDYIGYLVHAWRVRNFGEPSAMRNALQICEEAGEVARVVGKTEEGIRPDTRGNLPDELGDVLLSVCGMAAAQGIDLNAIAHARLERMESLDFTKGPEGVAVPLRDGDDQCTCGHGRHEHHVGGSSPLGCSCCDCPLFMLSVPNVEPPDGTPVEPPCHPPRDALSGTPAVHKDWTTPMREKPRTPFLDARERCLKCVHSDGGLGFSGCSYKSMQGPRSQEVRDWRDRIIGNETDAGECPQFSDAGDIPF